MQNKEQNLKEYLKKMFPDQSKIEVFSIGDGENSEENISGFIGKILTKINEENTINESKETSYPSLDM